MSALKPLELPGLHNDTAVTKIECREDGFLNATQICRIGGKRFSNWFQLDSTKTLVKTLSEELNLLAESFVKSKKGRYCSGSWIHPDLAIHLAMWVSPKFAVRVSRWVCEWRESAAKNEEEFQYQLANLEPGEGNDTRERRVQDALCGEFGELFDARREVKTPVGFIDLLTDTKLIEVKRLTDWKHAVGQLLCYSRFYPDHELWLYLFDCSVGTTNDEDLDDLDDLDDLIDQICATHQIKVRRLPNNFAK